MYRLHLPNDFEVPCVIEFIALFPIVAIASVNDPVSFLFNKIRAARIELPIGSGLFACASKTVTTSLDASPD